MAAQERAKQQQLQQKQKQHTSPLPPVPQAPATETTKVTAAKEKAPPSMSPPPCSDAGRTQHQQKQQQQKREITHPINDVSSISKNPHSTAEMDQPSAVVEADHPATETLHPSRSRPSPPLVAESGPEPEDKNSQEKEATTVTTEMAAADADKNNNDKEIEEENVVGVLDGFSAEERTVMLEEQARILAMIEQEKQDCLLAFQQAVESPSSKRIAEDATGDRKDNTASRSTAAKNTTKGVVAVSSGQNPSSKHKHPDITTVAKKNDSVAAAATPTATPATARTTTAAAIDLGSGEKVTLHDQGHTRKAIAEGTALAVQCASCQKWMQVTAVATLMFCPVCQTVSPVVVPATRKQQEDQTAASTEESSGSAPASATATIKAATAAARTSTERTTTANEAETQWHQMQADLEMAERLQREEYKRVQRSDSDEQQQQQQSVLSTALDWMGIGGSESSVAADNNSSVPEKKQKPLFSYMTDSLSKAATSVATALNTDTLYEDTKGNINGKKR